MVVTTSTTSKYVDLVVGSLVVDVVVGQLPDVVVGSVVVDV